MLSPNREKMINFHDDEFWTNNISLFFECAERNAKRT